MTKKKSTTLIIILLCCFSILSTSCRKETKKECYERGRKVGLVEGEKIGYWKAYRAFVIDSWKPTLAGVTIGAFGLILIIGFSVFVIKPITKRILLIDKKRRLIASAKRMNLLHPSEFKMLKDLNMLRALKSDVSLQLHNELKLKIQEQHDMTKQSMGNEVCFIENEIKKLDSKIMIIRNDIQNSIDKFKELLTASHLDNLDSIVNNDEIGHDDKVFLLNETQNIFLTNKFSTL